MPERHQVAHGGGLRRARIGRGGRRRRAVAIGDVENRVAERARPGDELARAGHGFRLAGAHPFAPGLRVVDGRGRAAAAPGNTVLSSTVSSRSSTTAVGRRASASAATLACSSAALPGDGRRDALLSQPVDLFGDGAIFRRRLHPQRGVQTARAQPFVGSAAMRDAHSARRLRTKPRTATAAYPASHHESSKPERIYVMGSEYFRANRFRRVELEVSQFDSSRSSGSTRR